jgi:hypothetical protein
LVQLPQNIENHECGKEDKISLLEVLRILEESKENIINKKLWTPDELKKNIRTTQKVESRTLLIKTSR